MRSRRSRSRRSRRTKRSRRSGQGGTSLLEMLVPGTLLASTIYAKNRSKKHVRSRNYLVKSKY